MGKLKVTIEHGHDTWAKKGLIILAVAGVAGTLLGGGGAAGFAAGVGSVLLATGIVVAAILAVILTVAVLVIRKKGGIKAVFGPQMTVDPRYSEYQRQLEADRHVAAYLETYGVVGWGNTYGPNGPTRAMSPPPGEHEDAETRRALKTAHFQEMYGFRGPFRPEMFQPGLIQHGTVTGRFEIPPPDENMVERTADHPSMRIVDHTGTWADTGHE